jgi:TRAP transporter TAXI family solute receptor
LLHNPASAIATGKNSKNEARANLEKINRSSSVWKKLSSRNLILLTNAELRWLLLLAAVLLLPLFWLLFRVVEPPPPKVVSISTGSSSGAYFQFGKAYATRMAKHGIKLEVLESTGSIENLQRLSDDQKRVDFAFVQSGISDAESSPTVNSLASVGYEPLWVFSKPSAKPLLRMADLAGKTLTIGVPGSGSRKAVLELLKANGVDASKATLLDLGGPDAVSALLSGKADAALVIAAASAPVVSQALDAGLTVMDFDQADAYVRRFSWLSKVVLPKGAGNLVSNYPAKDVHLLATSANLIARSDVHPAVAFLLLDIASEVHNRGGPLHSLKEFPNERNLDYEQSDESKRFFKTGRPFLQRYLPFWLANLIERLLVSAVPILAVLIPAFKLIPAFFDWREHSSLLQLYEEVDHLQAEAQSDPEKRASALLKMNDIEQKLPNLDLGASKYIDVYNFKSHLDLARARLHEPVTPLA